VLQFSPTESEEVFVTLTVVGNLRKCQGEESDEEDCQHADKDSLVSLGFTGNEGWRDFGAHGDGDSGGGSVAWRG